MEKVTQILSRKQLHFNIISPDNSLSDAFCRMSTQKADYLIVMENNSFVGLLTGHDITHHFFSGNTNINSLSVRDVMNNRLPAVDVNTTVEQCMVLMNRHHIRHLPVFDNTFFMGVVTAEDIIDEAVYHREEIFDQHHQRTI